MKRYAVWLLCAAGTMLLLAGCGGGGGDGDGQRDRPTPAPPSPVLTADGPPPTPAVGSYWITSGTANGNAFEVKAIVVHNAILRGREAFVVELTDDLDTIMLPEGAGVRTLYVDAQTYNTMQELREYQVPDLRYRPHNGQLQFPMRPGDRWRSEVEVIAGPDPGLTVPLWREYEVAGVEELTIAGRAVETLRVELVAASAGADDGEVYWFAPQIGIVKLRSDTADWRVTDYALRPRVVEDGVRTYCSDWARLDVPPLLYDNNVWGRGPLDDYEQCLLARDVGGAAEYGWRWDWPELAASAGDLRHQVKAYPGVLYGHKPWHVRSTTPDMPVRIADLTQLLVQYDVDLDASGQYNLAFDIFLASTDPPAPESATTEIMIWPHRSMAGEGDGDETMHAQPAEYRLGTVEMGGRDYELYRRANFDPYVAGESRPDDYQSLFDIIQFVGLESHPSGTLDLTVFLDYLLGEGYIEASDYVAVVEFGTEIIHGAGEVWVRGYEVTVE